MVFVNEIFGTLAGLKVQPSSQVLLTKNCPHEAYKFKEMIQLRNQI